MMFVTWLRWVATAPFGRPVVPDVYRMVEKSSGEMLAAGSSAPLATTSANARDFDEAAPRTTIDSSIPSFARRSSILSKRSRSAITTLDPESSSPYSSSGPVHHAFSATATAPIAWHAQKLVTHSG